MYSAGFFLCLRDTLDVETKWNNIRDTIKAVSRHIKKRTKCMVRQRMQNDSEGDTTLLKVGGCKKIQEICRNFYFVIKFFKPQRNFKPFVNYNLLFFELLVNSIASFNIFKVSSTLFGVALLPIKPILKTLFAVGPNPPLISTKYL